MRFGVGEVYVNGFTPPEEALSTDTFDSSCSIALCMDEHVRQVLEKHTKAIHVIN